MDWLKLISLMVAVCSAVVVAQGSKKKIRIHLPQKVKHIHHHKKIYITNHPASSQYAPAYLPTSEGAVAVSSTVALPTVAGLVPLKPMQLYEERQAPPLQGVSPAASKLLPLYRARGYYGPSPEWEEQEFDLVPPPEPLDPTAAAALLPSAFSAPSAPAASVNYPPNRLKVVKVSETPRKKRVVRKKKPKRVIIQDTPHEQEHPVSTFHEHFYSDVEGAGTIRKIKKPKRVEKIIDGDTEHIHTYSEEHIHKLVFDDAPKITGVAGLEPTGSMSALSGVNSFIPIKNAQTLVALDNPEYGTAGPFAELAAIGSLGTPSHLEYVSYNPREVTHDHVFHDHGELPPHVDIKESFGRPPKVSYTSQGLKINGATVKSRPKNKWKSVKPTRPTPPIDYSYYENMYSPPTRQRKPQRRPNQQHKFYDENISDSNGESFRPIPSFKYREKPKIKNHGYHGYAKPHSFRLEQESVGIPFSTASSLIHDVPFSPSKNSFSGIKSAAVGFSDFKDPYTSFKDIYSQNYDFDTYASSSNVYNKEEESKGHSTWPLQGKNKKKSISTQNISFGGQDHQTVVDHLADSSNTKSSKEGSFLRPSSSVQTFEDFHIQKSDESATPSMEYTITENSPAHDYYTAMAMKAFQEDPMSLPEASNNNFQFVEAPSSQPSPTLVTPSETTAHPTPTYFSILMEPSTTVETKGNGQTRNISKRYRSRNKPTVSAPTEKLPLTEDNNDRDQHNPRTSEHDRRENIHRLEQEYQRALRGARNYQRQMKNDESPTKASHFKYGDKL